MAKKIRYHHIQIPATIDVWVDDQGGHLDESQALEIARTITGARRIRDLDQHMGMAIVAGSPYRLRLVDEFGNEMSDRTRERPVLKRLEDLDFSNVKVRIEGGHHL